MILDPFVCFRSVFSIRLFGTDPVFLLITFWRYIISVCKDNQSKKEVKSRFFLLFLLVDSRIQIQEPQKLTEFTDPNPHSDPQHCFQNGSGIRFWKILGWLFGRELAGALWRRFFLSAGENEEIQVKGESEKKKNRIPSLFTFCRNFFATFSTALKSLIIVNILWFDAHIELYANLEAKTCTWKGSRNDKTF